MTNIISTTFDQLNLDDPFFDSFKPMYRNFSTWFQNKADEHTSCDVAYDAEGNLKAMLYTKVEGLDEDYSRMEKPFSPGVRLKIGTLKCDLRGTGLGRQFLEMAIERARQDPSIKTVYATIYANRPELAGLVKMFESYGFSRRCMYCTGETVFEYQINWWRTKN